jgi:predicted kinase
MSARTYATLADRAAERAQNGQSTILDATYSQRDTRNALRERLHDASIQPIFAELTAPDEALRQRLDARSTQLDVVSDARAEDFEMLTARYEAPDALEDARHVRVSAHDDPDTTTLDLLKQLIRVA